MHKAHWLRIAAIAIAFSSTAGCGATLSAHRMALPATSKRLSGLAVNQNVPHTVIAVFPKGADADETAVYETRQMLPSWKELYVVGYRGQLFTTRELQVELHPNTTLKRVKVGSEAQTEQLFTDLTNVATQATAIRATLKNEKQDPQDKANADTAKKLCTDMLNTNAADASAGRALTYEGLTACPPQ